MVSTFDIETNMQPVIDRWYQERGWQVDRSVSCRQYDLLLKRDGICHKIEEKFDNTNLTHPTFLVEILQDVHSGDPGWYSETRCDYLHWIFCQTNIMYRIHFDPFREWFESYLMSKTWHTFNLCPKGYGLTVNTSLKWETLMQANLVKQYQYGE